jgi:membrane-bound serine protease (ClpP class)
MEAFAIVALIGFGLLLIELLLPTGGVLAAIGIAGVVASGIIALDSDNSAKDFIGPALITLGVVSGIAFYFVTRKVIAAHRDQPVRTGTEEMIGAIGEARSAIAPEGQVFLAGTIWGARLAGNDGVAQPGDRVRVEAIDGLTLIVRPVSPEEAASKGVY